MVTTARHATLRHHPRCPFSTLCLGGAAFRRKPPSADPPPHNPLPGPKYFDSIIARSEYIELPLRNRIAIRNSHRAYIQPGCKTRREKQKFRSATLEFNFFLAFPLSIFQKHRNSSRLIETRFFLRFCRLGSPFHQHGEATAAATGAVQPSVGDAPDSSTAAGHYHCGPTATAISAAQYHHHHHHQHSGYPSGPQQVATAAAGCAPPQPQLPSVQLSLSPHHSGYHHPHAHHSATTAPVAAATAAMVAAAATATATATASVVALQQDNPHFSPQVRVTTSAYNYVYSTRVCSFAHRDWLNMRDSSRSLHYHVMTFIYSYLIMFSYSIDVRCTCRCRSRAWRCTMANISAPRRTPVHAHIMLRACIRL